MRLLKVTLAQRVRIFKALRIATKINKSMGLPPIPLLFSQFELDGCNAVFLKVSNCSSVSHDKLPSLYSVQLRMPAVKLNKAKMTFPESPSPEPRRSRSKQTRPLTCKRGTRQRPAPRPNGLLLFLFYRNRPRKLFRKLVRAGFQLRQQADGFIF